MKWLARIGSLAGALAASLGMNFTKKKQNRVSEISTTLSSSDLCIVYLSSLEGCMSFLDGSVTLQKRRWASALQQFDRVANADESTTETSLEQTRRK